MRNHGETQSDGIQLKVFLSFVSMIALFTTVLWMMARLRDHITLIASRFLPFVYFAVCCLALFLVRLNWTLCLICIPTLLFLIAAFAIDRFNF